MPRRNEKGNRPDVMADPGKVHARCEAQAQALTKY
jgi:hypothetical protein